MKRYRLLALNARCNNAPLVRTPFVIQASDCMISVCEGTERQAADSWESLKCAATEDASSSIALQLPLQLSCCSFCGPSMLATAALAEPCCYPILFTTTPYWGQFESFNAEYMVMLSFMKAETGQMAIFQALLKEDGFLGRYTPHFKYRVVTY